MHFTALVLLFAVALFVGTFLTLEAGRRLGRGAGEAGVAGVGAVEGAVFALLGLLLAFTFSGAASRFDSRRELVAQEANAVGTAWLRIDLLPEQDQGRVRDLFRRYLDSRLATYQKIARDEAPDAAIAQSARLQREIWNTSVGACRGADSTAACLLLLPALNEMIDITTTRAMAARIHPPLVVFLLLGALTLVAGLLAGYGMATGKARTLFHRIAFAAVIATAVYVIVDIEYPRLGLIRVDAADSVLADVRRTMER
ncbi:MAG: DUF4239 domain-containing protein [Acidobacteriota bacterium]